MAALGDETSNNTIKTDPNAKAATTDTGGKVSGSVSNAGNVSDGAKAANIAKTATKVATPNEAVLEELLSKPTKTVKAATSEVDDDNAHPPTSLFGGTPKPFKFDPTQAFVRPTDDDEASNDADEF